MTSPEIARTMSPMLSISETLDQQGAAAKKKAALTRTPGVYLVHTMLAGAYIGIGVVIMTTAGGPLAVAGSPWAPLVQGLVFGVALTIVVVAGGELATSAMMTLTQGALGKSISWGRAAATLLFCLVGNFLGALLFATLVHLSGALGPATDAGRTIAWMVEHKAAETTTQLFFRGILCNLLVCLAIWSAARLRSEGAKIAMIFACVMVFITSGFEHVVANMTTFSLGLLGGLPHATWMELGRNVAAVGLGNLVGGGLLVGAAYAYAAGRPAPLEAPAVDLAPAATSVPAGGAPAVAATAAMASAASLAATASAPSPAGMGAVSTVGTVGGVAAAGVIAPVGSAASRHDVPLGRRPGPLVGETPAAGRHADGAGRRTPTRP